MGAPRFREVEFASARARSAADKARFANRLADFINDGMRMRRFDKALHRSLSCCFGLNAEYDVARFAEEYFSTPQRRSRFLDQLMSHKPTGSAASGFSDVEAVIWRWLVTAGIRRAPTGSDPARRG